MNNFNQFDFILTKTCTLFLKPVTFLEKFRAKLHYLNIQLHGLFKTQCSCVTIIYIHVAVGTYCIPITQKKHCWLYFNIIFAISPKHFIKEPN